jgi:phosphoribosylformylglycinamidine cyclo-ligase
MVKTYSSVGINIDKVKEMHKEIEKTFTNYDFVLPLKGHYAGLFRVGNHKLAIHCDGVGSKILVAENLGKYDTIGIDCIAMNVNDLVCIGARPLVVVDYLALKAENKKLVGQIMKGLKKGAKQAECAIIGGETAILPDMLKGGENSFDLAATVVGIVENEPITGEKIKAGDLIIGLESSGIHSNGYTLARKLLDIKKWGRQMLIPTKIYVKQVIKMWPYCNGLAHITGGAFSKLSRIGRYANVGFLLDNMPKTKKVMAELERKVNDDYEFYRTFNGGIGMCIVAPKQNANKIIEIAKDNKTAAYIIGKVIEEEDVILKKGEKKISLLKT